MLSPQPAAAAKRQLALAVALSVHVELLGDKLPFAFWSVFRPSGRTGL